MYRVRHKGEYLTKAIITHYVILSHVNNSPMYDGCQLDWSTWTWALVPPILSGFRATSTVQWLFWVLFPFKVCYYSVLYSGNRLAVSYYGNNNDTTNRIKNGDIIVGQSCTVNPWRDPTTTAIQLAGSTMRNWVQRETHKKDTKWLSINMEYNIFHSITSVHEHKVLTLLLWQIVAQCRIVSPLYVPPLILWKPSTK